MAAWPRPLVAAVDLVNRRSKSVGVRLVRSTGKSRHFIHPKHLIASESHDWYVPYLSRRDRVLDVGCGLGAHTLAAARACGQAVGCDYTVGSLRIARAEAHAKHVPNARFFAWDVTGAFPFADRTWDRARDEFLAELAAGGFVPDGPVMPVVYDTPWAGAIDALGGVSLGLYARLSEWKRQGARERPEESTGFRVVAGKANVEARHGFAGARPSVGGVWGAISGPPTT